MTDPRKPLTNDDLSRIIDYRMAHDAEFHARVHMAANSALAAGWHSDATTPRDLVWKAAAMGVLSSDIDVMTGRFKGDERHSSTPDPAGDDYGSMKSQITRVLATADYRDNVDPEVIAAAFLEVVRNHIGREIRQAAYQLKSYDALNLKTGYLRAATVVDGKKSSEQYVSPVRVQDSGGGGAGAAAGFASAGPAVGGGAGAGGMPPIGPRCPVCGETASRVVEELGKFTEFWHGNVSHRLEPKTPESGSLTE